MNESGNHHSQQTDTRTENQRVLHNENTRTQGGEHYTLGSFGGQGEGQRVVGRLGRDNIGEMPDISDGEMEAANHIAIYVCMHQSCDICTCTLELKV